MFNQLVVPVVPIIMLIPVQFAQMGYNQPARIDRLEKGAEGIQLGWFRHGGAGSSQPQMRKTAVQPAKPGQTAGIIDARIAGEQPALAFKFSKVSSGRDAMNAVQVQPVERRQCQPTKSLTERHSAAQ